MRACPCSTLCWRFDLANGFQLELLAMMAFNVAQSNVISLRRGHCADEADVLQRNYYQAKTCKGISRYNADVGEL